MAISFSSLVTTTHGLQLVSEIFTFKILSNGIPSRKLIQPENVGQLGLYKVTTKNGYSVKVTEDQKIMTPNGPVNIESLTQNSIILLGDTTFGLNFASKDELMEISKMRILPDEVFKYDEFTIRNLLKMIGIKEFNNEIIVRQIQILYLMLGINVKITENMNKYSFEILRDFQNYDFFEKIEFIDSEYSYSIDADEYVVNGISLVKND